MGIAFSIFLIALGAILAFAVDANVSGIEVEVVGWILMGVGIVGLVISMILSVPRRSGVVLDTVTVDRVIPDNRPQV